MYRFLTIFLLVLPFSVSARWATLDDAPYEITAYNHEIKVKKDGTFEEIYELEKVIKNENGRENAAKAMLVYMDKISKLTVLEAKTIYQGKEYAVDKKKIEDKPLASTFQAFDQSRQVFIVYPKVEIGAKLVLKYKVNYSKTPTKNHYSDVIDFARGGYFRQDNIKITSEIPLTIEKNDPLQALDMSSEKKGNLYTYQAQLTKPLYQDVINEGSNSLVNDKHYTFMVVSSFANWQEYANNFLADYEKVLAQPLPALYQEIAQEASNMQEFKAIADQVIARIIDKINYHGNLGTIEGRLIPRDLADVAKSHYGDCKDYSSAVVAILRKLGFKAHVALVTRGNYDNYDYYQWKPSMEAQNHAIVYAEDKGGKAYWLDPTNTVAMAGWIFPDIADRKALIFDKDNVRIEKIPHIDPEDALVIGDTTISFNADESAEITTALALKGESAMSLTGAELYTSKQDIADNIYKQLHNSYLDEKNKKGIELPDLSSRIVKDISIKASYLEENAALTTNLGRAYQLKNSWVVPFVETSDDQVGDLVISSPSTITKAMVLKNMKAKELDKLQVKLVSPWLTAERQLQQVGNDIRIQENIKFHTDKISNEDLKSSEYLKLKADLKKYFKHAAVIFN
jgi:hypothetical protein